MFTRMRWLTALVVAILFVHCHGKIFERCELAQELHTRFDMSFADVAKLVCIAKHSSDLNSSSRVTGLSGGSHGLFQINDAFWCSLTGKQLACNVPCERLRDDDLADDIACVRTIYAEHQRISGDGYTAWHQYEQFCRHDSQSYIEGCFTKAASYQGQSSSKYSTAVYSNWINNLASERQGKKYSKCQLAQELYFKHKIPMEQIPTWVCIAQRGSNFDTAAVGQRNDDGSSHHGLFQISDLYWCSDDRFSGGKECGLSCSKLKDSDISDDVRCIQRIHDQHTRISGDGFTAWNAYNSFCRNQLYDQVSHCFSQTKQTPPPTFLNIKSHLSQKQDNQHGSYQLNPFLKNAASPNYAVGHKPTTVRPFFGNNRGKIYKKCELARELIFKHKMPMQQIPTWVCIAQHESNFNTAAVGRLNSDGSADHGLFQVSDLYWCSNDDSRGGKACNMPCRNLLDNDITDDIKCVKTIFDEHTRISGDGFTAWTVYNPYCRHQKMASVTTCFTSDEMIEIDQPGPEATSQIQTIWPQGNGKIYKKCELAQELYFKHKIPLWQIPIWVCIAKHESAFDTAAEGRLNADGSVDHGLFQISDLFWCSHDSRGGKACNLDCAKLLDTDITDDVRCIKTIYEEHTRISGDGFTAWTMYNQRCRDQDLHEINLCFDRQILEKAERDSPRPKKPTTHKQKASAPSGASYNRISDDNIKFTKPELFPVDRPFVTDRFVTPNSIMSHKPKYPLNHPFRENPFLNKLNATSTINIATEPVSTGAYYNRISDLSVKVSKPMRPLNHPFVENPFLNKFNTTSKLSTPGQPTMESKVVRIIQKPLLPSHHITDHPNLISNADLNGFMKTGGQINKDNDLKWINIQVTKKQNIPTRETPKSSSVVDPFLFKSSPKSTTSSSTFESSNLATQFTNSRKQIQMTGEYSSKQRINYSSNPFLSSFSDKSNKNLLAITTEKSKEIPGKSAILEKTVPPKHITRSTYRPYENNIFLQQPKTSSLKPTLSPPKSTTPPTQASTHPNKYLNSDSFRRTDNSTPKSTTTIKFSSTTPKSVSKATTVVTLPRSTPTISVPTIRSPVTTQRPTTFTTTVAPYFTATPSTKKDAKSTTKALTNMHTTITTRRPKATSKPIVDEKFPAVTTKRPYHVPSQKLTPQATTARTTLKLSDFPITTYRPTKLHTVSLTKTPSKTTTTKPNQQWMTKLSDAQSKTSTRTALKPTSTVKPGAKWSYNWADFVFNAPKNAPKTTKAATTSNLTTKRQISTTKSPAESAPRRTTVEAETRPDSKTTIKSFLLMSSRASETFKKFITTTSKPNTSGKSSGLTVTIKPLRNDNDPTSRVTTPRTSSATKLDNASEDRSASRKFITLGKYITTGESDTKRNSSATVAKITATSITTSRPTSSSSTSSKFLELREFPTAIKITTEVSTSIKKTSLATSNSLYRTEKSSTKATPTTSRRISTTEKSTTWKPYTTNKLPTAEYSTTTRKSTRTIKSTTIPITFSATSSTEKSTIVNNSTKTNKFDATKKLTKPKGTITTSMPSTTEKSTMSKKPTKSSVYFTTEKSTTTNKFTKTSREYQTTVKFIKSNETSTTSRPPITAKSTTYEKSNAPLTTEKSTTTNKSTKTSEYHTTEKSTKSKDTTIANRSSITAKSSTTNRISTKGKAVTTSESKQSNKTIGSTERITEIKLPTIAAASKIAQISRAEVEKYRKNPFSHPFFAKYNENFAFLSGNHKRSTNSS